MKNSKVLLLIGGSGFVGSAIGEYFSELGWDVRLLTRRVSRFQTSFPCTQFAWDGTSLPEKAIKGAEAVINLAGEGVAEKFWSKSYKERILNSRVLTARAVAEAIKSLDIKPNVFVQVSAVGFYGLEDRKEPCDEGSDPGDDFLAGVCQAWEAEGQAIKKDVRFCVARLGVVLGWEGGALSKLWDIYSSGLGSLLGNGQQWMNWVHIQDVVKFFTTAVLNEKYSGIYNIVAPQNITNSSLHSRLSQETASFKWLSTPKLFLKATMGERASLLLSSPKVKPNRLSKEGYDFKFPNFSSAFEDLLKERKNKSAHYIKFKQWIPLKRERVWEFFSSAENLEQITPPWLKFKIKKMSTNNICMGTQIVYSLKIHGVPCSWVSHISTWNPEVDFIDEQLKGPYKVWHHHHLFKTVGAGILIEDRIEYKMPFFPFGQVSLPFVKKDIVKIFQYRKKSIVEILCRGV